MLFRLIISIKRPLPRSRNGLISFHHQAGDRYNKSKGLIRDSEIVKDLLRNVGIVAHINAGKTTTTERILYHAGSTETVGDVDDGNTVTDYLVQERDRGITITSAAVTYNWKKHRVNLIDTPGHVDFTMEVERSLSVLDGVVLLLDASAGVEAQTITVWNQAYRYKLPNIIFLNKCDKPLANYMMCMQDLKSSLGLSAHLVQIPVQSKSGFTSIVNLIKRTLVEWHQPEYAYGSKFKEIDMSELKLDKQILESTEEEREKLVNKLCDIDEEFADHVLECDKISEVSSELLTKSVRGATINCQLSPVLVGSSFKYIGVQQLMDAILEYLPSPGERVSQLSQSLHLKPVNCTDNCAFIFKIMHDKRLGPLSYVKVCNGSLKKLQRLHNVETGGNPEQIKKIYRVFADELREIEQEVTKDDIVVVTGLSQCRTGDILGDTHIKSNDSNLAGDDSEAPFRLLNQKILVPRISQMEPVYFCSIESLKGGDQLKLEKALACISREDPSFSFEIDNIGITTIRGMGKLHLEIIRDRIKSEYGIESILGPLQISYRETIEGAANEEFTVERLINSVKNSLSISLYVRSKPKAGVWRNKMLRLDLNGENSLGRLRQDHRKAIEGGIASALAHGPSMGYPVIDCDVLLLDFKANGRCGLPVISSAASQCLTSALARCKPTLMEPIMSLEVVAPKEQNGVILSDISSSRRGIVESTSVRANGSVVIKAKAPLSSLADYSEFLRVSASGRATFSMELHSYRPMSESDKQSVMRL